MSGVNPAYGLNWIAASDIENVLVAVKSTPIPKSPMSFPWLESLLVSGGGGKRLMISARPIEHKTRHEMLKRRLNCLDTILKNLPVYNIALTSWQAKSLVEREVSTRRLMFWFDSDCKLALESLPCYRDKSHTDQEKSDETRFRNRPQLNRGEVHISEV